MALHKADLSLQPARGTIAIDGQTLTGVRSLDLSAEAAEIPRLTLELLMSEVEVEGEMTVVIPASTRQTLIALGWTPPEEA